MILGAAIGLVVALIMIGMKSYKQKQLKKQQEQQLDILDQEVRKGQ